MSIENYKQINKQGLGAGQMSPQGLGGVVAVPPIPAEIIRSELHALVRLSEQLNDTIRTKLAPIMCGDYDEAEHETLGTGQKLPPLFDDYKNAIDAVRFHLDEVVNLIRRVGI